MVLCRNSGVIVKPLYRPRFYYFSHTANRRGDETRALKPVNIYYVVFLARIFFLLRYIFCVTESQVYSVRFVSAVRIRYFVNFKKKKKMTYGFSYVFRLV